MRKVLVFFPILIFLFAFTCENESLDEDIQVDLPPVTDPGTDPGTNPGEGSDVLVGTWELVELTFDFSTSADFEGQIIESDIVGTITESDFSIVFSETTFNGSGSYTYDISGSANGVDIPLTTYTLNSVNSNGNYSVEENTITADGQFYEFDFGNQIETGAFDGPQSANFELSNDGNTLSFSQDETTVNTDNGVETTITTISNSVYQKVE